MKLQKLIALFYDPLHPDNSNTLQINNEIRRLPLVQSLLWHL